MIDKDLNKNILCRLDELLLQRISPIGSEKFYNLGGKERILEHLLYMKNSEWIEGQEIRTGVGNTNLQRIALINLTDKGRHALESLSTGKTPDITHNASQPTSTPKREWLPGLVLGSILLVFVIAAFFLTPNLTKDQRFIMLFMLSFIAGFTARFLGGAVLLEFGVKSKLAKLALSATSGLAVFLFLYLYPPYWHTTEDKKQDLAVSQPNSKLGEPDSSYINIEVRDKRNRRRPIPEAMIEILELDGFSGQRFRTNSDGGVFINNIPKKPEESIRILVSKPGYKARDEYVPLIKAKTFYLEKE